MFTDQPKVKRDTKVSGPIKQEKHDRSCRIIAFRDKLEEVDEASDLPNWGQSTKQEDRCQHYIEVIGEHQDSEQNRLCNHTPKENLLTTLFIGNHG